MVVSATRQADPKRCQRCQRWRNLDLQALPTCRGSRLVNAGVSVMSETIYNLYEAEPSLSRL